MWTRKKNVHCYSHLRKNFSLVQPYEPRRFRLRSFLLHHEKTRRTLAQECALWNISFTLFSLSLLLSFSLSVFLFVHVTPSDSENRLCNWKSSRNEATLRYTVWHLSNYLLVVQNRYDARFIRYTQALSTNQFEKFNFATLIEFQTRPKKFFFIMSLFFALWSLDIFSSCHRKNFDSSEWRIKIVDKISISWVRVRNEKVTMHLEWGTDFWT